MKNFLAPPEPEAMKALTETLRSVMRLCPVPGAHKKDQPHAVRDLSRLLTQERSEIKSRSYWASPRNTSAYVYYFLPWNLYRLSWLLPALDLGLAKGDLVVDLGSGPLTMILGLYCFRPELRAVPLEIVCVDTARQPMELGRSILTDLAGKDGLPWRIHLLRAPAEEGLRKLRGRAKLVTSANVLNELPVQRDSALMGRLMRIMSLLRTKMAGDGRILMVEPGTRLGGKLISVARKACLESGFKAIGPCPHQGPCPCLEQKRYNPSGPEYSGWCHFVFPAKFAPPGLTEFTARAQLDKDSLALSALYLACPPVVEKGGPDDDLLDILPDGFMDDSDDFEDFNDFEDAPFKDSPADTPWEPEHIGKTADLRVISEGIRLPGEAETARYVCSAKGLGLLRNADRVPSGAGLNIAWPGKNLRDRKTGALIFERPGSKE